MFQVLVQLSSVVHMSFISCLIPFFIPFLSSPFFNILSLIFFLHSLAFPLHFSLSHTHLFSLPFPQLPSSRNPSYPTFPSARTLRPLPFPSLLTLSLGSRDSEVLTRVRQVGKVLVSSCFSRTQGKEVEMRVIRR